MHFAKFFCMSPHVPRISSHGGIRAELPLLSGCQPNGGKVRRVPKVAMPVLPQWPHLQRNGSIRIDPPRPTETPLIVEISGTWDENVPTACATFGSVCENGPIVTEPRVKSALGNYGSVRATHQRKANHLFFDNHVALLDPTQICPAHQGNVNCRVQAVGSGR